MDQKERIIEQAMHMFVSQGIKSVRMDDIAQQLGVSKRTLYELFGDKEGLLYLAMDRYFEKKRIERAAVCAHARNVLEAMFMVLGGVMDNAEVIQRLLNNLRKFYPAVHDKMTHRNMYARPALGFAPSDGGYLRQGKAKAEAHTLCMCKPVNAVLAQIAPSERK